jgi:hypothetical protein
MEKISLEKENMEKLGWALKRRKIKKGKRGQKAQRTQLLVLTLNRVCCQNAQVPLTTNRPNFQDRQGVGINREFLDNQSKRERRRGKRR